MLLLLVGFGQPATGYRKLEARFKSTGGAELAAGRTQDGAGANPPEWPAGNGKARLPEATRSTGDKPVVCLVGGTRPEGLKLGPVVAAMTERGRLRPLVVASGQHPIMFDQALAAFRLQPDVTMPLARSAGGQAELASRLLPCLDTLFAAERPSAVLVQGDTSTTLAAALAAFWRRIPVVHLEAGLRSWDIAAPFPEEGNRKLVGQISSLHLAPTPRAAKNLSAEGIVGPQVLTIGNTIVDAARTLSCRPGSYSDPRLAEVAARARARHRRLVLTTVHRRESWGEPLRRILAAVADLVAAHPDVELVVPAHPNPLVRDEVWRILGFLDRVTITEPLPYVDVVRLLKCADLVLTDSGGIQEEVVSFGVPVLVLREVTERMEAVESGIAHLVGSHRETILQVATRVLSQRGPEWPRRAVAASPFGDGRARYRAEEAVAWHLGLQPEPPAPFVPAQPDLAAVVAS
ncbi:MAG: non-hydrolyzing UDP-N-acetylglucosamine 2-epimerase [Mycobacteriales bacterium]